jgi:hypothetical protein
MVGTDPAVKERIAAQAREDKAGTSAISLLDLRYADAGKVSLALILLRIGLHDSPPLPRAD